MLYGTLNLSGFIINEIDARNAYPYTKTVFSCPFVEKFNLEIETFYLPGSLGSEGIVQLSLSLSLSEMWLYLYLLDGGQTENVFNLTESELSTR